MMVVITIGPINHYDLGYRRFICIQAVDSYWLETFSSIGLR